jgi:hypothetical protein
MMMMMTHEAESFLKESPSFSNLILSNWWSSSSSLACFHDPTTGLYPEPDESSPHRPMIFLRSSFSLTHSWSWSLVEKLSIVRLLKNFPAFYETRGFITVFTRALHWFLSWAISIQSIPSHPISLRSISSFSLLPPFRKNRRRLWVSVRAYKPYRY